MRINTDLRGSATRPNSSRQTAPCVTPMASPMRVCDHPSAILSIKNLFIAAGYAKRILNVNEKLIEPSIMHYA